MNCFTEFDAGYLEQFFFSISKINSQLKVKLNTNSEGDGEKVHTNLHTSGFFGTCRKYWCACAALLITWKNNWKLYLSIYLFNSVVKSYVYKTRTYSFWNNNFFLQFSIFLETIPCNLFVPQYVLYSFVFHVILLK